MIDISDGLSSELHHICQSSGVGCIIYNDSIPIHADSFKLAEGQSELIVSLTGEYQGLQIEKRFTFQAGKYDVRVEYLVKNISNGSKVVQPYTYLAQTIDAGFRLMGEY